MTFFGETGRCKSALYLSDGRVMKCQGNVKHSFSHLGKIPDGNLIIKWTTKEGLDSRLTLIPKLAIGSIEAWRGWGIGWVRDPENLNLVPYLQSTYTHDNWDGPVMTVKREADGSLRKVRFENVPSASIPRLEGEEDHGVYSYKTPELLIDNIDAQVYGRCEISGHMIEHDLGFRSQKLVIAELWIVESDFVGRIPINSDVTQFIKPFEDRYQCPVQTILKSKLPGWSKYYTVEAKRFKWEEAETKKVEAVDVSSLAPSPEKEG